MSKMSELDLEYHSRLEVLAVNLEGYCETVRMAQRYNDWETIYYVTTVMGDMLKAAGWHVSYAELAGKVGGSDETIDRPKYPSSTCVERDRDTNTVHGTVFEGKEPDDCADGRGEGQTLRIGGGDERSTGSPDN